MSAQGWLLLVFCAICASASGLFMKGGINSAGGFEFSIGTAMRLCQQPLFVLGAALHLVAAIVWIKVLATEAVSTAYPLFIGITFLLILVGAVVMLNEAVTAAKLLGVALLVAGIYLLR